eukprot:TRINITY_DN64163_c0_g2_i1.p1 TRINITY_DN64163_c0_g2~~TRINITY_DN64163_c0_g2_i1.p1  ORF type:complete len:393 (+),score=54.27 TRINITY_DN64163_c0_g2_i1:59-1237(+)
MKKGRPTTSDRLTELCKDESFGGNSDDDGEKPKDSNEVKDMIADLDAKWKQLDDMMNQCTRNMVRNFAPVFRRLANPKDGPPDPAKMNGRLAPASWPPPKLAVECSKLNRGELGGKITASEYLDSDEVLDKKMDLIAKLIRKSKHTCAYCGAGLSRGAGISDYATKAEGSVASSSTKDLGHPTEALPTAGHHILTALQKAGFIHSFVQQNHDGLPQKAGFPQRLINEIHGGWYDPSNTVVPMSGQLRKDLADWMVDVEEKTELTLCLGTSLSGMTSDRLATTPAMRSEEKDENGKPCSSCIGTGIINLQQASEDDEACVRVWSRIAKRNAMLANKLGLEYNTNPVAWPKDTDVFEVTHFFLHPLLFWTSCLICSWHTFFQILPLLIGPMAVE